MKFVNRHRSNVSSQLLQVLHSTTNLPPTPLPFHVPVSDSRCADVLANRYADAVPASKTIRNTRKLRAKIQPNACQIAVSSPQQRRY